jgi:hypothetical protein
MLCATLGILPSGATSCVPAFAANRIVVRPPIFSQAHELARRHVLFAISATLGRAVRGVFRRTQTTVVVVNVPGRLALDVPIPGAGGLGYGCFAATSATAQSVRHGRVVAFPRRPMLGHRRRGRRPGVVSRDVPCWLPLDMPELGPAYERERGLFAAATMTVTVGNGRLFGTHRRLLWVVPPVAGTTRGLLAYLCRL